MFYLKSSDIKNNIVSETLKQLNAQGYGAVTIRNIAHALDISPGNFAYHFKNIEDVILQIYEIYFIKSLPVWNFENMATVQLAVRHYLKHICDYEFLYTEKKLISNSLPLIKKKEEQRLIQFEGIILNWFQNMQNSGLLSAKLAFSDIHELSKIWVTNIHSYPTYLQILFYGKSNKIALLKYENHLWQLLLPHATIHFWREWENLQQRDN